MSKSWRRRFWKHCQGALRLIHVADQFLRERKAEQGNWWNTEEGKAEMARVKEEFDVTTPPIYERRPGNLNDS